jgi:protocatechuate 3,4-dioxygenase beta subunit
MDRIARQKEPVMNKPFRDEEDDDRPVGRLLTRREVLAGLLAGAGAVVLAGCDPLGQALSGPVTPVAAPTATSGTAAAPATATTAATAAATATTAEAAATATPEATLAATLPSCVVRPEMTEGPYFVDEKLNRADVRSDPSDGSVREGVPLRLTFLVSQIGASACTPLAGAMVDIWHCDAAGVYSDATDRGFSTKGKKFLRGYQVTDNKGVAGFTTIYPGWYAGRAVHIHFKIRTIAGATTTHEFTSQLFFDDTLSDTVFTQAPYAGRGQRTTRNANDGIYRSGGDQLLLQVRPDGSGGYAATFDIGLQFA